MATNALRPELEELPQRMRHLPVDERGFCVPWFVPYKDGKPEFRAMDPEKRANAVKFKFCWVCGGRLGRFMTFVAGPMCGINRASAEPPCHIECARWSARNCPWLNNPDADRRVDEVVTNDMSKCPGIAVARNPGVIMLWTTRTYSVFPDHKGNYMLMFGNPVEPVEWYRCGKPATRVQVTDSIGEGIHLLVAMAIRERGGIEALREAEAEFEKHLPKE